MSHTVVRKALWSILIVVLIAGARAWATPPLGFIANTIYAVGFIPGGMAQHIQLNKNPDGSVKPWGLQLQVLGDTDHQQQRLVLAPGGYSGWHRHPGLLVATVKSGRIDLYDENCQKRTVTAGEVYTENDAVHGIINTGSEDAELYISYLVKRGLPRRQEAPAPACAPETGIP
jgi:quercetin dioxygenase-like cupin family protein